jgi:hypothetical protein
MKVIKYRGIKENVKICDKTPEGTEHENVEDLCPKCHIGRVIGTDDSEWFPCTHCRFRKIVPRI